MDGQRDTSPPFAASCKDIARAPVTNWEPQRVALVGYCYAVRHGMKVQLVTPYRVSHLQRYGVTVRGNVTSVYLPLFEDAVNCEGRRIKYEYRAPKETGSPWRRPRSSSTLSTTHPTRTSLALNSVLYHRGRRLTVSAMDGQKYRTPTWNRTAIPRLFTP